MCDFKPQKVSVRPKRNLTKKKKSSSRLSTPTINKIVILVSVVRNFRKTVLMDINNTHNICGVRSESIILAQMLGI